jgi:prepilin-type processing-associated H-X9-DG protein
MAGMKNSQARRRSPYGFSVVELLVVIGVVAMLISILLPALVRARESAQMTQCMSNLRQWGVAARAYADANGGWLPREGDDGDKWFKPVGEWADPGLWFNALPPVLNAPAYSALQEAGAAPLGVSLPGEGDNSIFVCPAASRAVAQSGKDTVDAGGYFLLWGNSGAGANPVQRPTFICYVINSKLSDSDHPWVKLGSLEPASDVVLMAEKLMSPEEVDPAYSGAVGRLKASWERVAARHRGGAGNLLFADGHVAAQAYRELNPTPAPSDFNLPGVAIWNPRGPAQ